MSGTEDADSSEKKLQIRYCPVCGSDVNPLFERHGARGAESTVECPEHGEVMIEYYEPS